uniref:Uncharacterized protein n=1 Tax=Ovis aries TaxID=9940 RepID=A0AC11BZR7_SHEEP
MWITLQASYTLYINTNFLVSLDNLLHSQQVTIPLPQPQRAFKFKHKFSIVSSVRNGNNFSGFSNMPRICDDVWTFVLIDGFKKEDFNICSSNAKMITSCYVSGQLQEKEAHNFTQAFMSTLTYGKRKQTIIR